MNVFRFDAFKSHDSPAVAECTAAVSINIDYDISLGPVGPVPPIYLIVSRRLANMSYWTFENQTVAENLGPMRLYMTTTVENHGCKASVNA